MDQYDHKTSDPLLPPSEKARLVVSISVHLFASQLHHLFDSRKREVLDRMVQQSNYWAHQLLLDAEKEHPEP